MAKLDKSFVVIRFRFGEGDVKGRQASDNTYRYAVKRVAVSYAEKQYEVYRGQLQATVEGDVKRELVNMANLYKRHIIGADGSASQPSGTIQSLFPGSRPLSLPAALPAWAPRSAKYLQRKFNARAGSGWFDNSQWVRRKGQRWAPKDAGLLGRETSADAWEAMFGPVSVRFFRDNKLDSTDAAVTFGTHERVQIGKLMVYAFGQITPQMLPALNTKGGVIPVASDQGNDGLMRLVEDYDPRLAYRLGKRSTGSFRYRPTLEPFLSYFLTRSIPAAVQARIAEGSLANLRT